jgi:hypothetical protein
MAVLVMNIFSLDSNSFIISVAFTLLMSGLIVYLMNTKISRIEKNIQNQNHVLTGIINGLQEDMRCGAGAHHANDTISNREVSNCEVSNCEVSNCEVSNGEVSNGEVSNGEVCNISEKDHLGEKINVSSDDDYSSDSSEEDSSDEDETANSSNKKITLDGGRTDCIDQQHYLNEMARNTFTIGAETVVDVTVVDVTVVDVTVVDEGVVDATVGDAVVTVADSSDSDSGEDSDSDDDDNLGTGVKAPLEIKSIGIENPISAKPLGINLNKLKVPELKALVVDKVLASPDSANNMKKKDLLGLLKKSGGEKGATTS